MAGSRYGRCPGCRRPVLRLVHAVTGRVGLLEPQPHKDGVYRVPYVEGSVAGSPVLVGTYTTARGQTQADAGRLHRSHFAACLVDRPRPKSPRRPGPDDVDDTGEEERCCHACGFRLHDDLFGSGMPAIYATHHPLCIPVDRVAELDGLSCATRPRVAVLT